MVRGWGLRTSMKMMEGLATSSTPMVRRLRCSTLSPEMPGSPVYALRREVSSINSRTCTSKHCFTSLLSSRTVWNEPHKLYMLLHVSTIQKWFPFNMHL